MDVGDPETFDAVIPARSELPHEAVPETVGDRLRDTVAGVKNRAGLGLHARLASGLIEHAPGR
ncbi:MAG: hypothetical protein AAFR84_14815 [Pseudomonadota bacterium]